VQIAFDAEPERTSIGGELFEADGADLRKAHTEIAEPQATVASSGSSSVSSQVAAPQGLKSFTTGQRSSSPAVPFTAA
jgi:hypothetical protein